MNELDFLNAITELTKQSILCDVSKYERTAFAIDLDTLSSPVVGGK